MVFDAALLDAMARGTLCAVLGVMIVLTLTRVVGLRTFSKMTAIDFVITVAIGSLLAGAAQATEWTDF
ncbi:MAG: DUF421 domain-containing protein, partial [Myxococcota bacterium]